MTPLGAKRCEKGSRNRCQGGKKSENTDFMKTMKNLGFPLGFSWFLKGQRHQNSWKFIKFTNNRLGI